jgi:aerobic carbon-monoxide dehydrogenase medium subunit
MRQDFEYHRPSSIEEALDLYSKGGPDARILAGGTELINEMRIGKTRPKMVIDLKAIASLDFMDLTADKLRIGALYRVRDAEASAPLRHSPFGALSFAAGTLGSPQVRNKATIVGNLCRCSPSADLIPPLVALGAQAMIKGVGTQRTISVEELLLGPGKTALLPGEILTELVIPDVKRNAGCSYYKLSPRKSLDLAVVGVAVMVKMDSKLSTCTDARIVLGAVAPTAIRAKKSEVLLIGSHLSESVIEQAALAASEDAKPLDDVRASAWYRKRMVDVAVKRAIGLALEQTKKRR